MKPTEVVTSVQSPMNKLQLVTLCLASLLNGFNDGSLGAILPYMERDYSVGYAVVSLIFIGQGIGCLFAAIFLDDLYPSLGPANVFRIANMAVLLGYILMVAAAPFPLIPIAFSFVGFGKAINRIVEKILCSYSPSKSILPEIIYGCYGIGAIASPLVATAMVTVGEMPWSRFYIINIGLAVSVLVMSSWSFQRCKKDPNTYSRDLEVSTPGMTAGEIPQSLCTRTVILPAIFILALRGVEASISGWTIAFLIDSRMGNPQLLGYVLASFWAGIAVGRFDSSGVEKRSGQKSLVYGFIILTSAFQLLVWFMPHPNNITIAAFAVGAMLGTIYLHVAAIFMRPIAGRGSSKEMITITAIGSLGGAIASFITGLLAQLIGTTVLHPVVLTLLAIMMVCWWGIPSNDKRCGSRS